MASSTVSCSFLTEADHLQYTDIVCALLEDGSFLFTSSGGFSNIYAIPDYQKSAVDSYFANYNPPYPYYEQLGGFNASSVGDGIYNRIGHGTEHGASSDYVVLR